MISQSKYIFFIVVLAMMSMVGLMASDICLPAFPEIKIFFDVSELDIQQTLSIYLLGLSVSQLFYGSLSDHFGRKKILLIGMVIFTIASAACAIANSIYLLIFARFFQAVGACAGMVIGRAIVSDLFNREQAAVIFATIFPVVGMSPALSPLLGGYMITAWGWQSVFIFLTAFGVILVLLLYFFLDETAALIKSSQKQNSLASLLTNYFTILKSPTFLGYTFIVCCAYGAYFAYIAESPFIFKQLGFVSEQIGYFYITLAISYIVGNIVSRKLISRFDIHHVLAIGLFLFLLGGVALVLFSFDNDITILSIIIPMTILTAGNGFLLPLGVAGSVTLFPAMAGSASGLMGFLQLAAAALSTHFVGHVTQGSTFSMALYVASITISAFIVFIFLIARVNNERL